MIQRELSRSFGTTGDRIESAPKHSMRNDFRECQAMSLKAVRTTHLRVHAHIESTKPPPVRPAHRRFRSALRPPQDIELRNALSISFRDRGSYAHFTAGRTRRREVSLYRTCKTLGMTESIYSFVGVASAVDF